MNLETLKALVSRHCRTLIGDPQPVDLSRHCPLFAYVCAVSLPAGCTPPAGRLPMRIGAGAAPSSDWARTLSLFEAAERYSLQYRTGDPESEKASAWSTSTIDEMPTQWLRLGHPQTEAGAVDSRGCAIGRNQIDASVRSVLELIERDAVEAWRSSANQMEALRIDTPPRGWLNDMLQWLDSLGRELNLLQVLHPSGASTFISVCCDIGGTKPVWGSAAGFDPALTLSRASIESVVSWRNLMAIDMNGLMDEDLPPAHAELLRIFRGREPIPNWRADAVGAFPEKLAKSPSELSDTALRQQLDDLLRTVDYPVSIFDLTRKDMAVPVVRVVRQHE